jgi:hypothetical protein
MVREIVRLKLLKHWKNYAVGDVVSVPTGSLQARMLQNGTAEHYMKPEKKAEKKIEKIEKKKEKIDDGAGEDLGVSVCEEVTTEEHNG